MNLGEFMTSQMRNAWIEAGSWMIYVRKSTRPIDDQMTPCLDVANMGVNCSSNAFDTIWGAGMAMLQHLRWMGDEAEQVGLPVYIENVLDTTLLREYQKRGYELLPSQSTYYAGPPCMVKRAQQSG